MKIDRDKYRKNLTRYTKRALEAIPELNQPLILDIGCGSGIPSLELARLTNGKIIGIDNDPAALKELQKRASESGYDDIPFTDNTFDIVWAEGSIAFIGFGKGIRYWKRLIKPDGYLVVHDELVDLEQKLKQIKESGYYLLDHFTINESVWWDEYFGQLQKDLGEHYEDGALTLEGEALEVYKEIEMYHKEPEKNRSVYFIMQKL